MQRMSTQELWRTTARGEDEGLVPARVRVTSLARSRRTGISSLECQPVSFPGKTARIRTPRVCSRHVREGSRSICPLEQDWLTRGRGIIAHRSSTRPGSAADRVNSAQYSLASITTMIRRVTAGSAGSERVIDEVTVVVIDLEEYFDTLYGQDRAVVLAIRVIVTGECIESRDCSEDTRNGADAQCLNSRRDQDPATPPKAAELIIQLAYPN